MKEQKDRFLTTLTFEFPIPASLSWYLSDKEQRAIDVSARGNKGAGLVPFRDGRRERFLQEVEETDLSAELRRALDRHDARFDELIGWWKGPGG